MTTTLSVPTWSKAVLTPATEFGSVELTLLQGRIPPTLHGSLYRNGPGRLERGGQKVGHWFDGDGAILAVHFGQEQATGVYRYVQTTGYQAETAAGRLLYAGYGMTAPVPLWQRFGQGVKNAANTSVLALPDKLLALWEGGRPHELDLTSLDTIGLTDLDGLTSDQPYSAHPKTDPLTSDIFNFGITYGIQAKLHLYRSDCTGRIRQQASLPLDWLPLIHDFVLAGAYLIFCIPPVQLNPLGLLTQQQSYSDSLHWQPHLGTRILIIDRETLQLVTQLETDPWYQWHFGNGWVESDGSVVFDLVHYADFQTNQYLKEVVSGQTHTQAQGSLWQVRLDPSAPRIREMCPLIEQSCEFPTVDPAQVGQFSRFTYLCLHRTGVDPAQEFYGCVGRWDHQQQQLTVADLGEGRYPSEPIFAADPARPGQGWILTVVFDGLQNRSEVWVFDAERLEADPVCRLGLPGVIPPSFHGTWQGKDVK